MVNIQKIRKNDISFGNKEENNKGGNTNTALGVGLGAGVLGYFGGKKFLTTDPNVEQVLAKPDEFIPSNLSAEEQKAADAINTASKEMSEFDKKVEEEVSKEFSKEGVNEKNLGFTPEQIKSYIDKDTEKIEKLNKEIKDQHVVLDEKTKKLEEQTNWFKKKFRELRKGAVENSIKRKEKALNASITTKERCEVFLKIMDKDGKITKDAYKTQISDVIKNRIVNKAEEALTVLKGKLKKVGSTRNTIIAAIGAAVVGFFATKMLTKPKEAPIPEETEKIEVVEKSKKSDAPEEVEVVEVTEETQEVEKPEESDEKAA